MTHLKKHFNFFVLVSLIFLTSVYSNISKKLEKYQNIKSMKFVINGKVSIEIASLHIYLPKNHLFEFEEYRNWTLFKSLDGRSLLMFGLYTEPNHYDFLSYNDTTLQLTLNKSQTVDSQKHLNVFQLVVDKLKHFVTDKYLCFKEELCKHWREGNDVDIEYTLDFL